MKRALAVLISVALLAWLAGSGDWRAVGARLSAVSTGTLALVLAGFLLSYLLRAARLQGEFADVAAGRFAAMLRIALVHNAAVNVVPFRGGEIALPILLNRTFGVAPTRAVVSLLWLRLQDAFVVLAIAAWLWPGVPTALRVVWTAAVVAAAWGIPAWARRHPAAQQAAPGSPDKVARLRVALAHSTRGAAGAWGWTLANWSVKLAAQSVLLAALLGSGLRQAGAGVLGAELAAILPVQGVAGFGTYEAGVAAALAPLGIAPAPALQAALALHLIVIAAAVSAGAAALALLPGASPALKGNENP